MAGNEIEPGRCYFCREESSGEGHSGTFHIDEHEIAAAFCSFDKPLPKNFADPMLVRLENGQMVSLYKNVVGGGTTYNDGEGKAGPFTRRVISNIAVIGRDPWHPADRIRRVQFSIAGSDDLLHHSDKFDAIADADFGEMPDPMLFELSAAGCMVKVWYAASGNMTFKRATTIAVRYAVEFDDPTTLDTYLALVICLVRFVSAAFGHRLAPSDIAISRLSFEDFIKAVEARTYEGDYKVRYIWPSKPPSDTPWVGNSFVHVRDDSELAAFVDCLRTWIERDEEWRGATNLMMRSLSLEGVISGERLLTACKWLEEIPGAASALVVSEADIDRIALAAAAEADRLGHTGYRQRIAGVIRGQLKTETNGERFERLEKSIATRLGGTALGSNVVPFLLQAMRFRGKVAHGHFDPKDDDEYKTFVKSVYAMEALCYLLTIKDLPMTDEGAKRALGRDIASNYRHCIY
jgi:hypothetical protein